MATVKEATTISLAETQHVLDGKIGLGVRGALAHFYPNYISDDDLFGEHITRFLQKDSIVLDAGCGRGTIYQYSWRHQVKLLVGCDRGGVSRNLNISGGVGADLGRLPFAQESFDVIFSRYVFEHLDYPETVMSEFSRVLKPGGKLILITPSKYHYVALVSRSSPHWFHEMVGKLRGNAAQDIFPTRYRANSKPGLTQYANQARLTVKELVAKEVRPNYLLWSLPSFMLGMIYERLVNRLNVLAPLRAVIIAVFEK